MVWVGETVVVPLAATVPIPGLIETEVAFVVLQVSVAGLPTVTLEGEAERVAVIAVAPGSGGVPPPHPITTENSRSKTMLRKGY